MRKIVFRGKTVFDGTWRKGDLIGVSSDFKDVVFIRCSYSEVCKVDPATVGQFTGMTDCEGREIFEDDIIRWAELSAYECYLESKEDPEAYDALYIESLETHCTIEALSREGGLDDGFRSIYCSVDEIHQHKDNKVYKSLYNGTRKLPETLVSMITTRGDNLNSFCKEMDDYCKKILRREATAEDFFVDIYCPDDGDNIRDEATWAKANPITCYDPDAWEILRQDARTAFDMGGADLRDFITKSLNMWVRNADNQAFDPDAWNACASDRTIEDIAATGRRRCIVGLDLSSGGDLTSLFLEFDTEGEEPLYLYSHSCAATLSAGFQRTDLRSRRLR